MPSVKRFLYDTNPLTKRVPDDVRKLCSDKIDELCEEHAAKNPEYKGKKERNKKQ